MACWWLSSWNYRKYRLRWFVRSLSGKSSHFFSGSLFVQLSSLWSLIDILVAWLRSTWLLLLNPSAQLCLQRRTPAFTSRLSSQSQLRLVCSPHKSPLRINSQLKQRLNLSFSCIVLPSDQSLAKCRSYGRIIETIFSSMDSVGRLCFEQFGIMKWYSPGILMSAGGSRLRWCSWPRLLLFL